MNDFPILIQPKACANADQIESLQKIMLSMPQAPGMETQHYFAGGMYCRRIEIPKNTVIVSKVHKTEHFFIGCQGDLAVAGQGENYVLSPGDIRPSPIGTKRVVHAITDVVVLTVHKTDLIEAGEALENELIQTESWHQYDINNQPKPGVIVDQSKDKKMERKL